MSSISTNVTAWICIKNDAVSDRSNYWLKGLSIMQRCKKLIQYFIEQYWSFQHGHMPAFIDPI